MFSDIWFILSTRLWSRLILAITHIHIPIAICGITLIWSKLFFQWSGKPQKQLTITKHSKQTWKLELWRVCSLSVYHNMPEKEEKLRRKLQHTDNACVCLPQSSFIFFLPSKNVGFPQNVEEEFHIIQQACSKLKEKYEKVCVAKTSHQILIFIVQLSYPLYTSMWWIFIW